MRKNEFSAFRHYLEKSQTQLARLLGISSKAVQSFEQGWRNIPVHTERQLLLLAALKHSHGQKARPCWVIQKCPPETRRDCPAWELRAGHLCWFISGTICHGSVQKSWKKKMAICHGCLVFQSMLPASRKS